MFVRHRTNRKNSGTGRLGLVCLGVLCVAGALAHAEKPRTRAPFIYVAYTADDQAINEAFREDFVKAVPDLLHASGDMRFLGRHGFGTVIFPSRKRSYDAYTREIREHLAFLRDAGLDLFICYLCNQSLFGNAETRMGAWEVYDNWHEYGEVLPFPKPPDPITWLQREPNGDLHYNYPRLWARSRAVYDGLDLIRYAPCPNNPDWRELCENEARLAASMGLDGLFVDNCIIHCYCDACEKRFQAYLERRYTPGQLREAFGTADYGELTLYSEGDVRHWAQASPDFIPWLEAKFPPGEREDIFGTRGPLDSQHVANAGGGMIMGQASAFVAERYLPPDVKPSFENVRLANPALQTPAGRLRWAETTRFWADSIGEMLAELRDAGRRVNPDFFVLPNWGTMQRVNATAGRAEDGKDLWRMRAGADWQMFEEGFTTGRIAPGLILEYDMELRFALANRVRAILLPYHLAGRGIYETAMAEAAAGGGSVYVGIDSPYPDLQEAYKQFFSEHTGLYEGYQSSARVALAHFFEQVHFLNTEHLRQVHALNRYLADQQILFDHVTEEGVKEGQLEEYDVVILPNVAFAGDEEVAALQSYIRGGGHLVTIGETATRDTYCRPRETELPTESGSDGRIVHFSNLDQALPHTGIYLEPVVQAAEEGTFAERYKDEKLGKYACLTEFDGKLWVKRYQTAGPLTEIIAGATGTNPHVAEPREASGVRCLVYEKQETGSWRLAAHLVNKNVPMAVPEEERVLQPVEKLVLSLPLPSAVEEVTARLHVPGHDTEPLETTITADGRAKVILPKLNAYAVIALSPGK